MSNAYYVAGVDISNCYNSRTTTGSDVTNLTGYKINNVDLRNIFVPLGTNSNLIYKNINYNVTSANLSSLLELKLFSSITATYTATAITNGVLLKITGNGNINFKYDVSGIQFLLVGGGGAGGATYSSGNAGGGGGAGEVAVGTIPGAISSLNSITIGAGGIGPSVGTSNTSVANGSPSSFVYSSNTITVYGGGYGGSGKQDGISGGSGGGGGSWSNENSDGTFGGNAIKHINTINITYYANNGGRGEFQGNDSGRGGGGGGATTGGGNGGSNTPITSSYGGVGYTWTPSGASSIYVGGGGGGGADQYSVMRPGGLGGGGNGGYNTISPTAGSANTGGGGGGAPNNQGNDPFGGANGGSGVLYLAIYNNNLIIP